MGKRQKKFKKNITTTVQTHNPVQNAPEKDVVRSATISDLKKTAIIIAILFALEFLIFYANLMGTGA